MIVNKDMIIAMITLKIVFLLLNFCARHPEVVVALYAM
jgi:hypothetical protein